MPDHSAPSTVEIDLDFALPNADETASDPSPVTFDTSSEQPAVKPLTSDPEDVRSDAIAPFPNKPSGIQSNPMTLPDSPGNTTLEIDRTETQPSWLPSTTSESTYRRGRTLLDQAINEYRVGAWASAEASVWQALRQFAEAIAMSRTSSQTKSETTSPMEDLHAARAAIIEARDFTQPGLAADAATAHRIAISHQTRVLRNSESAETLLPGEAVDRYLDDARVRLSRMATINPDAAEAMDLLAAIYLGRNEARLMPGQTSLCLRRAALQGQPNNASLAKRLGMQLADTGLLDEAYLVLTHAYSLDPTVETSRVLETVARLRGGTGTIERMAKAADTPPAIKRPQVVQLSPNEFAAISQPVMQVSATGLDESTVPKTVKQNRTPTEQELNSLEEEIRQTDNRKPSTLKRLTQPFSRLWK